MIFILALLTHIAKMENQDIANPPTKIRQLNFFTQNVNVGITLLEQNVPNIVKKSLPASEGPYIFIYLI